MSECISSTEYRRPLWLNGILLTLIVGLVALAAKQGEHEGIKYLLSAVALLGVGTLSNLVLAYIVHSGRGFCLVFVMLHGLIFFWALAGS